MTPELATVLERLDRLERRLATAITPDDLLWSSEVDRLYRLREGTALADAKAGLVRAAKRRTRGRDCYLIRRSIAEQRWGDRAK